MIQASPPTEKTLSLVTDPARLAALRSYGAAAAADNAFADIVGFAAALCETPVALVSFVEADRQVFKGRVGFDDTETPIAQSICAFALEGEHLFVVPDARLDARFAHNPLVSAPDGVRFYAGAPLRTDEGIPLGTVCVIDTAPRAGLTPLQEQGLRLLADQVMARLGEARQRTFHADVRADKQSAEAALALSEAHRLAIADSIPQLAWMMNPDGWVHWYNRRWYDYTGMTLAAMQGWGWQKAHHPDHVDRVVARFKQAIASEAPWEDTFPLRGKDGRYRWFLSRAEPFRDAEGRVTQWFGTYTDIDDARRVADERELVAQELSHRIKNIFSVMLGLISLSAQSFPAARGFADELRKRVHALGRAHNFVRPHSRQSAPSQTPATLHGLLRELLSPYGGPATDRIVIKGIDTSVDDRAATPVGLAIHELATNAAKYGCLSRPEGRLRVVSAILDDHLQLDWTEEGGPGLDTAAPPDGFGTRLIDLSVQGQLGGTIERQWTPQGLSARLRVPLAALTRHTLTLAAG